MRLFLYTQGKKLVVDNWNMKLFAYVKNNVIEDGQIHITFDEGEIAFPILSLVNYLYLRVVIRE